MAIIGNNIPNSAEKVKIDGKVVKEKLELYNYQDTLILKHDGPPDEVLVPKEYDSLGEFYNGDKLYYNITSTTVTDGSLSSDAGINGTVMLVKKNGTQLIANIPSYTIPDRSVGGSGYDSRYSFKFIYNNIENIVYLQITRRPKANSFWSLYTSYYKLNINDSELTWEEKAIEIFFTSSSSSSINATISETYVENDCVYVGGYRSYKGGIYLYKFSDQDYTFKTYGEFSTQPTGGSYIAKINNNEYIYFYSTLTNSYITNWISITKNEDGSYSEAQQGTARYDGRPVAQPRNIYTFKAFQLNNDFYIMQLQDYWNNYENPEENPNGLRFYKLNSDRTGWEEFLVFSDTANDGNTTIFQYIDETPKWIVEGEANVIQRGQETFVCPMVSVENFNFSIFEPNTLIWTNHQQTPKSISSGYNFEYFTQDSIHIYFYFYESVAQEDYIVTIERLDKKPVLYSSYQITT